MMVVGLELGLGKQDLDSKKKGKREVKKAT